MDVPPCAAAFFDLDTLAFVPVSADGDYIDGLRVYPGVGKVLKMLPAGVRLGVLADPGRVPAEAVRAALKQSRILRLLDESLIVFGSKTSSCAFRQAASLVVGREGGRNAMLLYVGEDAAERAHARAAGFLTALHPVLALSVLRGGGPLRYLRIRVPPVHGSGDWRARLREKPLVPLHLTVEPGGGGVVTVYAAADAATAAELDDLGFWVDRLGAVGEPEAGELYLLHDDLQVEKGFLEPTGNSSAFFGAEPVASRVLASTHEGLLVSLPAGESVERFHFRDTRHGHTLKLVPSVTFLKPVPDVSGAAAEVSGIATDFPSALASARLSGDESDILVNLVTPQFLDREVARYIGMGAGAEGTGARSRHIHHAGNAHAVDALVDELALVDPDLLTVCRHGFTHDQRTLTNVVATLKASRGMEGEGIVVVSAHLDSTAKGKSPYHGSTDPAPGADDDASGIAGVLAAAHACVALVPKQLRRREMRFVLFNAEEHGKAGSIAYAQAQSALRVKIIAVFQMDMIGYDREPPPHFELHAGFPNTAHPNAAAAAAGSVGLADLIERLRNDVSPGLPKAQISTGRGDRGGGRSDHSSFHAEGYPACLVTQDFFSGHGGGGECNPNYHLPTDTEINGVYAADIARVVAAAAWVTATR